jgi:hypothetical protein
MLSNQDWDQIIIGIGNCVVRCGYQLVVKWMDYCTTRVAIDMRGADSHTRLRREPHDDRNP